MKARYVLNRIFKLLDYTSKIVSSEEEIGKDILMFYTELLGKSNQFIVAINKVVVRNGPVLDSGQRHQLLLPISDGEIDIFSKNDFYNAIRGFLHIGNYFMG